LSKEINGGISSSTYSQGKSEHHSNEADINSEAYREAVLNQLNKELENNSEDDNFDNNLFGDWDDEESKDIDD